MKRLVSTDGNGSNLIDVKGLGQYVPIKVSYDQEKKINILKNRVAELEKNICIYAREEIAEFHFESDQEALDFFSKYDK